MKGQCGAPHARTPASHVRSEVTVRSKPHPPETWLMFPGPPTPAIYRRGDKRATKQGQATQP